MTDVLLQLLEHGIAVVCLSALAWHHVRVLRLHQADRSKLAARIEKLEQDRLDYATASAAKHEAREARFERALDATTDVLEQTTLTLEAWRSE